MKLLTGILCGMAILAATLPVHAEENKSKQTDRLTDAQGVMNEVMATPDRGIPSGILAGAQCVAVIPAYKKAAFVVGGQYGRGVATCRTPNGWSAPVFLKAEGGSFGWQIG